MIAGPAGESNSAVPGEQTFQRSNAETLKRCNERLAICVIIKLQMDAIWAKTQLTWLNYVVNVIDFV